MIPSIDGATEAPTRGRMSTAPLLIRTPHTRSVNHQQGCPLSGAGVRTSNHTGMLRGITAKCEPDTALASATGWSVAPALRSGGHQECRLTETRGASWQHRAALIQSEARSAPSRCTHKEAPERRSLPCNRVVQVQCAAASTSTGAAVRSSPKAEDRHQAYPRCGPADDGPADDMNVDNLPLGGVLHRAPPGP